MSKDDKLPSWKEIIAMDGWRRKWTFAKYKKAQGLERTANRLAAKQAEIFKDAKEE